MILLSGTHLSMATHICGDQIAKVKWSFSDEKATCGMENLNYTDSNSLSVSSACCHDQISNYSVDKNYKSFSFSLIKPVKSILLVYLVPDNVGFTSLNKKHASNTNVQPPGAFIASAVNLSDICVFRI